MSVLNEVLKEYGWKDRITADNQDALNDISLLPPDKITDFVGILGKIIKQYLFDSTYSREDNQFSQFFSEKIPVGQTVEDIYIDIIEGTVPAWDDDGSYALSREKPDIKTLYHTVNYEQQYKVSTSFQQAKKAFLSAEGVENLMMKILSSLHTSCEYDLYLQCCELISVMHKDGIFTDIKIAGIDTEDNIKSTIKTMKNTVKDMKFMTDKYNPSKLLTKVSDENLILLLPSNISTTFDVDLLSGVFNLEKMSLDGSIITVQEGTGLGTLLDTENTVAIAMDKRAFRIFPTLFETSSIFNPASLVTNTFLTTEWIFSYSKFFNCVRFTTDAVGGGE